MSTRFYFIADTPGSVTPVASGTWNATSQALVRQLSLSKQGSGQVAGTTITWTAGQTALDRRYVSPPLQGDQTIAGTIKCYFQALQTAAGTHARTRMEVYVVSRDGATVRGTLLSLGQYGVAADFNTAYRDKSWASAGTALTSVNALDGDRVIVCIGYSDASGTTPSASVRWGEAPVDGDVAEDETAATAGRDPWVEFSGTYAFSQVKVVQVDTKNAAGGVASFATNSRTPTANALQIVVVTCMGVLAEDVPVPTITGCGLTWVHQLHVKGNANPGVSKMSVFAAMGASPTTGVLTIDFGGTGQQIAQAVWYEATGTDSTIGSAIIRSVSGFTGTTTTFAFTIGSDVNADSGMLFFVTVNTTQSSMIARPGWGTITAGTTNRTNGYFRCNGDTTASVTGNTNQYTGIALEIEAYPPFSAAVIGGGLGGVTAGLVALPKLESMIVVPTGGYAVSLTDGDGTAIVTLPAGNYFLSSTAPGGTRSLAAQLALTLGNSGGVTYAVSVDDNFDNSTGRVTITPSAGTFSLTWTATALRDLLGFAANIASSAGATSPNHARYLWLPNVARIPQTPDPLLGDGLDHLGRMEADYTLTVAPSGATTGTVYSQRYLDTLEWQPLFGRKMWIADEQIVNESFQRFWIDVMTGGGPPWRYHRYRDNDALYWTEVFDADARELKPAVMVPGWVGQLSHWRLQFGCREYVLVNGL